MKLKSTNKRFDEMLRVHCGRYYGKEIATFTIEEMRRVQSWIDKSWNEIRDHYNREEYSRLKSDVNRNLIIRGSL
jgi:hypothetical protein